MASKDFLYKLLIVGHQSVGKTSLMRKYTAGIFDETTRPTVGCDFVLKVIQHRVIDGGDGSAPGTATTVNVTMQLWDIAGQDHNASMNRNFYQGAYGVCVVADIKRLPTYEKAVEWKKSVDKVVLFPNSAAERIPCILLLNKCDLGESEWSKEQIDNFCKEHGFANWFAVSAKTGENLDAAMADLVGHVVKKHRLHQSKESAKPKNTVGLQKKKVEPEQKSKDGCKC